MVMPCQAGLFLWVLFVVDVGWVLFCFLKTDNYYLYAYHIIFISRVFLRIRESNHPLNSEVKRKTIYGLLTHTVQLEVWEVFLKKMG